MSPGWTPGESGAPGGIRTPNPLLRSYTVNQDALTICLCGSNPKPILSASFNRNSVFLDGLLYTLLNVVGDDPRAG
jgi:hypothetical protein